MLRCLSGTFIVMSWHGKCRIFELFRHQVVPLYRVEDDAAYLELPIMGLDDRLIAHKRRLHSC